MAEIHPTAMVSKEAQLGSGVVIGPGCVISGRVTIADNVRLIGNVYVQGPCSIGAGTIVYPFACLGFEPQDYKFKPGQATPGVVIGSECLIREHATVHSATKADRPTIVGDRVFMMVGSHVGHDARLGNNVILVNGATMGGHSEAHDNSTIGGHCGIHQFTRIGRLAFLSGGIGVSMDVPPFCMAPDRQRIAGINRVGMRRSGLAREEITAVDRAFREVFRVHLPKADMIAKLEELSRSSPAVGEMLTFVREAKRAICPGPGRPPRLLASWLNLRRRGGLNNPLDESDDESM